MSEEFLNVLQEFVIFVMAACTHLGIFCNMKQCLSRKQFHMRDAEFPNCSEI